MDFLLRQRSSRKMISTNLPDMLVPFSEARHMELISPQRAAAEKKLRYAGRAIDKLLEDDKLDYTIFEDGHVKIKFVIANTKYKYYFKKPNYQEVWHWMKKIAASRQSAMGSRQ